MENVNMALALFSYHWILHYFLRLRDVLYIVDTTCEKFYIRHVFGRPSQQARYKQHRTIWRRLRASSNTAASHSEQELLHSSASLVSPNNQSQWVQQQKYAAPPPSVHNDSNQKSTFCTTD